MKANLKDLRQLTAYRVYLAEKAEIHRWFNETCKGTKSQTWARVIRSKRLRDAVVTFEDRLKQCRRT